MPLDDLAPERARVVERRDRPDRAQVREQAESLAQPEQALLGTWLGGVGRVPLGAADGGEQHGVGAPARLERLVGQRDAVRVDRRRRRRRAPRTRSRPGATVSSTSTAGARISGPIPSPGSSAIVRCHRCGTVPTSATGDEPSCSGARSRGRAALRPRRARGRRTGPAARSGSRSRWRTRHTVWTNARGSSGGDGLRLEPRLDVGEPGGAQRAAVCLGVGVVPGAAPVREVRRERLVRRRPRRPAAGTRRCCRARRTARRGARRRAACGGAPRTARRGRGSSETWRWRRSTSTGSGSVELDQVLAEDRRALAERLLGVLGHRRRDVDAVHAAVAARGRRAARSPGPSRSRRRARPRRRARACSRSSCSRAQR